ncbi:hypothetical protein KY290_037857 [Solanum tuberosum]|uniref:Apyrase n=1 Tax=Solanum tuberosum TaxID=4113 RepID=A0ABQ7TWR3_SOLTU|nr:hypothetical protein KY284_037232 [Solanum tuberosum]KAH0739152.1 hypothetical protein KY290_037857 [Solanum tuberosum]
MQVKPGLSSYENDPKAAAKSLEPLLLKAASVVPINLHPDTPVELGVRNMLKNESIFEYKDEWVSILSGTQEGSYFWVGLNYLLRTLGKSYQNTVATIDLGGGSVQMAFALSKENSEKAPINLDGEKYVLQKSLMGANYYLYVHSYLNYGLLASRAEILKVSRNSTSPCILKGTYGYYTYGGAAYKALHLHQMVQV